MKAIIPILLLLAPVLCRAAALPSDFGSSRINASGVTYLMALPAYSQLALAAKEKALANAAAALGIADGQVVVELPAAGELWRVKNGKPAKLDSWSDNELPLGQGTRRAGRWFASFGMQGMSGGDYPSGTLNMRLGSTLYKGRYDAALTYDYSKQQDALVGRTSLGLVSRALLPINRHGGWNVGAELYTIDNYGVRQNSFGLVTGLNVYLPGGSFDVTLNLRDKGAYGLLVGYTLFITR